MKFPTLQINAVRIVMLTAGLSLAVSSKATVPASDLPDFDNLPNFAQLGNNLNEHNVTINGNIGVSAGGNLNIMAASTINGDGYIGTGASTSGANRINGSLFTGQDLSLEQATVFSASAALAALTPDVIINPNQTASLSYDVPAGQVQVVNLNGGLNLGSGQTISMTGDGFLVLNIMGSFSLSAGTAGIFGPNPSNIFINYLGTSNFSTTGGPTVNGQIFLPNAGGNISGMKLSGSLFSGNQQVTIMSSGVINAVPIPEPGTMSLAVLGGISMILLRRRLFSRENSI